MDTVKFIRADSENLPKIDIYMILIYMKTKNKYNVEEIRAVKSSEKSYDGYLDSSVGYVAIKRHQEECIVRARVVPEYNTTKKHYMVSVHVNEEEEVILDSSCDDCAASEDGCQHSSILLSWLEKRSSECPPTSVQCYWKRPILAISSQKYITLKDMYPKSKRPKIEPNNQVLEDFLEECRKRNCGDSLIMKYNKKEEH